MILTLVSRRVLVPVTGSLSPAPGDEAIAAARLTTPQDPTEVPPRLTSFLFGSTSLSDDGIDSGPSLHTIANGRLMSDVRSQGDAVFLPFQIAEFPVGVQPRRMRLGNDAFLTELSKLLVKSKESKEKGSAGSVLMSFKRYRGTNIPFACACLRRFPNQYCTLVDMGSEKGLATTQQQKAKAGL
jgi:hypothetical protein